MPVPGGSWEGVERVLNRGLERADHALSLVLVEVAWVVPKPLASLIDSIVQFVHEEGRWIGPDTGRMSSPSKEGELVGLAVECEAEFYSLVVER